MDRKAMMMAKNVKKLVLMMSASLITLPLSVVATAQDAGVSVRVEKLEKEMRAVQRKVFPNGAGMTLDPQITGATGTSAAGMPASAPMTDLSARVDALEKQLATLTGQVEQQGYRLKKIEEMQAAQASRIDGLSVAGVTAPVAGPATAAGTGVAATKPAVPAPVTASTTVKPATTPVATTGGATTGGMGGGAGAARPVTGDGAEDGYLSGYDLWEAKDYVGAQKLLTTVATKYPKHKRYSYAQNLLGRAYLDEGKPVTAAKVFLENYRTMPQGERAADSLYFLGVSLIQLKKLPDACKSFDELQAVYGANMRDYLKERLPAARKEAQCAVK